MDAVKIAEPLLVRPRLDEKPWGGNRLAHFGIDLGGSDQIGEAVLTSNDAVVAQGQYAGQTLGELVALDPAGLLGPVAREFRGTGFPLLAKLIDAHENLSIQVHPSDDLAPEDDCGKTEAWFILEAAPGAVVYAGLQDDASVDEVRDRLERGETIVPLVRAIPVAPGDALFLPAGTIHALGAGIVLFEIQQQSAITYRLEDWGRKREMHVEAGMRALNPEHRPAPARAEMRTATAQPEPPVRCEYFALEVIQVEAGERLEIPAESGPQVFTCVRGGAKLRAGGQAVSLDAGSTAVLFANAGAVRISSETGGRLLRGWIGG
jgi:mannose-6-phosphate isomerase